MGSRDGDGNNPSDLLMPHTTIKVWDAKTGELKKALDEEKDTDIHALVFSPDKKHVAIAGNEIGLVGGNRGRGGFVRIVNADTWAVEKELDDPAGVSDLAFSPDGKVLALGGGSYVVEQFAFVILWDVAAQKIIGGTTFGAAPESVDKPEAGKRPKGLEVLNGLVFSSDGKTLAAAKFGLDSKQAMIEVFDGETGKPMAKWDVGESKGTFQIAFTSEGKRILSACGAVKVWDAVTGKELTTLEDKENPVFRTGPPSKHTLLERGDQGFFQVAASPDGRHLATSRLRKEKDGAVHEVDVWTAQAGGNLKTVTLEPGVRPSSLAFSHDGKTLAISTATLPDIKVKGGEKAKGELQLVPLNGDR